MEAPAIVKNPQNFWLLWGSIAAIWQAVALKKHNGATGSETTRAWWRVETKIGKRAFLSAFYLFAVWFVSWFPGHIVNPIADSISSSSGGKVEDDDN